jgi:predicted nucleic acid-binding Zn ribbon protein
VAGVRAGTRKFTCPAVLSGVLAAIEESTMTPGNEDDSNLNDRELPDPSDMDQDGDSDIVDTLPCPYCGKPVYDGAEQCPRCGNYLSAEERPVQKKPLWIVIAAVVCLIIIFLWILRGL